MTDFSKNKIKWIRSLRLKKNREELGLYIIEGEKIVDEAIENCPENIHSIYYTSDYTFSNSKFQSFQISTKELDQISSLKTPNKVLAVMKVPHTSTSSFENEKLILILDGVQDPGNMGTILRTADWFGINAIICSENTVDVYNPKVIQATMGAIFRIKVQYMDLHVFLAGYKNPVYGAFLEGENLYTAKMETPSALVMGNEGGGISKELRPYITKAVSIPRFGHAESLNVSIATGILVSEFFRKIEN